MFLRVYGRDQGHHGKLNYRYMYAYFHNSLFSFSLLFPIYDPCLHDTIHDTFFCVNRVEESIDSPFTFQNTILAYVRD